MADIFFALPPDMARPPSFPSFTSLQQVQTRTLLLRLLPPELVFPILHLASYYHTLLSWREKRLSVASPRRERYLLSDPLPPGARLEGIKIAVRAMDQGFLASGRIDVGDAEGFERSEGTEEELDRTHSFFEICLVRGEGEEEEKEVDGSRRVVFSNRYAFPRPLTHIATFSRSSPLPSSSSDLPNLIALSQPGDRLALDAVADASWWVNIIESARIEGTVSYFCPSFCCGTDFGEKEGEEKRS